MLLTNQVCLVVLAFFQLSASMKLEDLHKLRQFLICDKSGQVLVAQSHDGYSFMVVTSPTNPQLNGIVLNSSNILTGLSTLNLSLTIKDHYYYASTADGDIKKVGSSEVPLEDFTDVFLLHNKALDRQLETATSLSFSNDGKTWISVEVVPANWHVLDENSGSTDHAIVLVKLSALLGKITCTGETQVKNKDGVQYEMVFDSALEQGDDKENRPLVFTWFIPKM